MIFMRSTHTGIRALPEGVSLHLVQRTGVVLLAVLIVVAILTLASYSFFGLMNAEYEAVVASNRLIGARAAAESGVHYAAFVLSNPQTAGLSDSPESIIASPMAIYDNPNVFHMQPVGSLSDSAPNTGGYGQPVFSIVSPRDTEDPLYRSQGFRFGVEDESGKININALLQLNPEGDLVKDTLVSIPAFEMTPEQADSIFNWMRAPESVSDSFTADTVHYSSFGYEAKHGNLETLEELLLVRDVTPIQLLGNDQNRNGYLEPEEDDGSGVLNPGWSRYMTVYSRERNLDATGQPKFWINDPNLEALHTKIVELSNTEIADYVLNIRKGNDLIAGLIARMFSQDDSGGGRNGQSNITSLFQIVNESSPLNLEDKDTLRQYLPIVFDQFTTDRKMELAPRINVNTASPEIIAALVNTAIEQLGEIPEGLGGDSFSPDEIVQKIVENQPNQFTPPSLAALYQTPAWLVTEAELSLPTLLAIEPFISARSQVYRMQVVGYYELGGPTVRVEAVIDSNYGRPRILYWRDITELGRGFDLRSYAPGL